MPEGLYIFYMVLPIILISGGFGVGKSVEIMHHRSLDAREAALKHILIVNLKEIAVGGPVRDVAYVDGQAVIGSDYFKTFASQLRMFFGGEMRSLQTIMARARREAIVRMLEHADELGANVVCNVRIETSNIGRGTGGASRGLIMAEVHAYGTAICFEDRGAA